ncbi:MAG TPA: NAD(P)-binding protein, partial [Terriglobales bacterium]|nr:NAD(P)-binding protein [Terriglobales bacterium]
MSDSYDRELGMKSSITRRDFLNGVAVAIGGAIVPEISWAALPDQNSLDYYPPALTGLRGSHLGSFEVAHKLRDGDFWQNAGTPGENEEKYDLIIVGGGISGLSAAHFFRKENPSARILILD